MNLVNIGINEFKNKVYPEYIKIFPKEERHELKIIEQNYDKKIMKFIKICENNQFVGFFIINKIENNQYVQLDYFAILEKYQNKGYGTKAIQLLKSQMKEYDGIFVEIEKLGLGKDEQDNLLRERRAKFYEKLGFEKLNFELKWFTTLMLSVYVLPISTHKDTEENIMKNMFQIYIAVHGKEKVDKDCEVIKNNKYGIINENG